MQCSKEDVLHVLFGTLLVELVAVLIVRLVVRLVACCIRRDPPT